MTMIFTAVAPNLSVAATPSPGARLLHRLITAYRVHRQRQALKALSDAQLADIGIDRAQADAEAARDFWEIPAGQRRG